MKDLSSSILGPEEGVSGLSGIEGFMSLFRRVEDLMVLGSFLDGFGV